MCAASLGVAIAEKSYGPEHPNIARHLNNLAELYYNQGRYAEAEPLYRRALVIDEKSYGPDRPNVAWQGHDSKTVSDVTDHNGRE